MKEWGPKVRYVLRNPGETNFLAGYPGILPGAPEKFEKKKFVFNWGAANGGLRDGGLRKSEDI